MRDADFMKRILISFTAGITLTLGFPTVVALVLKSGDTNAIIRVSGWVKIQVECKHTLASVARFAGLGTLETTDLKLTTSSSG